MYLFQCDTLKIHNLKIVNVMEDETNQQKDFSKIEDYLMGRLSPDETLKFQERLKKTISCNFCGKMKSEAHILIAGTIGHICETCIIQSTEIVLEELDENWTNLQSDLSEVGRKIVNKLGILNEEELIEQAKRIINEGDKEEYLQKILTDQDKKDYLAKIITKQERELFELKSKAKKLIRNNFIKEVLELISNFTEKDNPTLNAEIILIQSKYKSIDKAYRNGVIDFDKTLQNHALIVHSLLKIIDEL